MEGYLIQRHLKDKRLNFIIISPSFPVFYFQILIEYGCLFLHDHDHDRVLLKLPENILLLPVKYITKYKSISSLTQKKNGIPNISRHNFHRLKHTEEKEVFQCSNSIILCTSICEQRILARSFIHSCLYQDHIRLK